MTVNKALMGALGSALTAAVVAVLLWGGTAGVRPVQAAVVLQYHHVSDSTPESTSVTPARFRKHMEYLEDQGFDVVPLEKLVRAREAGEDLPDDTVAITFDDAYESVYTEAFPLLKDRDWPFTVFVNTQPLDDGKSGFTDWDQLREMAESGATIANHSTRHNHLQRRQGDESERAWRQRIESEVVDAEARIEEETGQSHKMLAYPYGEYNHEVKSLLEELGYTAFGQQSGPIGPYSDLRALPRFPFGGPYGNMEDFVTKVNTRPMPIDSVALFADEAREELLDEVVVAEGARPVLVLTLSDASLAGRINCFASGQGAMETEREGRRLVARPDQGLTPGRSRYNCTASTGESGRFHWFSQQWLVTDEQGNWVHEN